VLDQPVGVLAGALAGPWGGDRELAEGFAAGARRRRSPPCADGALAAPAGGGGPLGWRFVLYKYGPFSFDLREELGELRAEDFLRLEPPPSGYGPPLEVDQRGRKVMEQFNDTTDEHEGAVADVVEFVGTRGVSGLERLATAVYLVLHKETREDEDLARELCDIKAHVSEAGAREAVARGREFLSGSGVPS
jgi:hypothetical protein